jgi:phosphatidylinositol glycan class W
MQETVSEPDIAEAMSYKLRHEAFVTGLSGGDVSEVYKVSLVAVSAYAAWGFLQSRLFYFRKPYAITSLIADFSLNWMGPLFAITLYSSMSMTLNLLVLGPAALIGLSRPVSRTFQKVAKERNSKNLSELGLYLPKRSYLTCYRGGMLVLTCAAILAVDFQEFPRRFAKVESWGTSLMDLGVGSFVFSMGLVSARGTLVDVYHGKKTTFVTALLQSFKQSLTVLLLGIIRLVAVKAFDYHEHVTEYGVHWNFFMTLGLLPPLVSIVGFMPKHVPTVFIALIIGIGYELVLNFTELSKFILTAPRVDVLSSNKEGIFSFIGYLSIFLSGKSTGFYTLPSSISDFRACLFPQTKSQFKASKTSDSRLRVIGVLFGSSLFHNALFYASMMWVTPSRRLANLPYILWTVSYNTAFLALYVAVEALVFGKHHHYELCVPTSLDAINFNGLGIFLLANISTGIINMKMNTLDATRFQTMATLVLYLAVLFVVSIILYRRVIRIKL